MGGFSMAAKHHMTNAELYEKEIPDLQKSMENYEKAADYYKGEEAKSSANTCLLKVAQYASQLENYRKAIDIYEEVGISSADSSLLTYSANEYFFKAALCCLCLNLLDAQDRILAVKEKNADAFTNTVKDYDKISRLDQWTTSMLSNVKKHFGEAENDELL